MPDSPTNDRQTEHALSIESQRAIDSYFDDAAPLSDSQSPHHVVARLLALLDPAPNSGDESRLREVVDSLMARLMRRPGVQEIARVTGAPAQSLTPEAARAVDALIESGWTSPVESPSAALVSALDAGLEGDADPAARAALIDSTLARVQARIDEEGRRFRMPTPDEAATGRSTGLRLGDLSAVAAILLLGSAIIWPMLSAARDQAHRQMCASNLRGAAMGFTAYASDYADALPQARASFLGGPWWDVGVATRSHSANLYRLVKQGYSSGGELSCPGNSAAVTGTGDRSADDWRSIDEVSFSYQHFGPRRPTWNQGSQVLVLADKSPVVARARRGESYDATASSRNHDGLGQHLLMSDGSLSFHARPVREGGDNIWLPANLGPDDLRLTGRERPADSRDSFVGP